MPPSGQGKWGSGHAAVVIPVMTQHHVVPWWQPPYAGITRGRKLVVLVGQRRAVGMAVRGKVEGRRWSKLAEWLA